MSKAKTRISLAVSLVLLAVTGWWNLAALPLTAAPSAPLPQAGSEVREPVHVGSNVMMSKLVHRVDPEYLSHLTVARPSGLVILTVVVGKQGEVQQVDVVQPDKNNPAMDSSAMDAVRQWRYEPYLLNGQPIRVRTTVFLRFPPFERVPQIFNVKNEVWRETESALKNTEKALKSTEIKLKNTEYLMSEMARIFPHAMGENGEIPDELERVRKKFERVVSEMAGIDLRTLLDKRKVVLGKMERVRTVMDRVRSEIERVESEMLGLALKPGNRETGPDYSDPRTKFSD